MRVQVQECGRRREQYVGGFRHISADDKPGAHRARQTRKREMAHRQPSSKPHRRAPGDDERILAALLAKHGARRKEELGPDCLAGVLRHREHCPPARLAMKPFDPLQGFFHEGLPPPDNTHWIFFDEQRQLIPDTADRRVKRARDVDAYLQWRQAGRPASYPASFRFHDQTPQLVLEKGHGPGLVPGVGFAVREEVARNERLTLQPQISLLRLSFRQQRDLALALALSGQTLPCGLAPAQLATLAPDLYYNLKRVYADGSVRLALSSSTHASLRFLVDAPGLPPVWLADLPSPEAANRYLNLLVEQYADQLCLIDIHAVHAFAEHDRPDSPADFDAVAPGILDKDIVLFVRKPGPQAMGQAPRRNKTRGLSQMEWNQRDIRRDVEAEYITFMMLPSRLFPPSFSNDAPGVSHFVFDVDIERATIKRDGDQLRAMNIDRWRALQARSQREASFALACLRRSHEQHPTATRGQPPGVRPVFMPLPPCYAVDVEDYIGLAEVRFAGTIAVTRTLLEDREDRKLLFMDPYDVKHFTRQMGYEVLAGQLLPFATMLPGTEQQPPRAAIYVHDLLPMSMAQGTTGAWRMTAAEELRDRAMAFARREEWTNHRQFARADDVILVYPEGKPGARPPVTTERRIRNGTEPVTVSTSLASAPQLQSTGLSSCSSKEQGQTSGSRTTEPSRAMALLQTDPGTRVLVHPFPLPVNQAPPGMARRVAPAPSGVRPPVVQMTSPSVLTRTLADVLAELKPGIFTTTDAKADPTATPNIELIYKKAAAKKEMKDEEAANEAFRLAEWVWTE